MDYIGGGFGSKFAAGAWAEVVRASLQKSGGKPVKLFLDRATELHDRGQPARRPSARSRSAAKKDGTITAWQSQILGDRRFRRRRHASPARTSSPTSPTRG